MKEQTQDVGQNGGRNDFKLSSQAFKIAVKMAEYIRSKKRGYFASVGEKISKFDGKGTVTYVS